MAHYMPFLKSKQGEFRALRDLSPSIRFKLTPVIEIVPHQAILPKTAKSITENNDSIIVDLIKAWKAHLVFVDHHFIEKKDRPNAVIDFFTKAATAAINAAPVIHINSTAALRSAVRVNSQKGLCIRLVAEDFASTSDLATKLNDLVAELNTTPKAVDLVMDLGVVDRTLDGVYANAVIAGINSIPSLMLWKSFTLVGGSFPVDLSAFAVQNNHKLPRHDWRTWLAVMGALVKPKRLPGYGDYGIAHPQIPPPMPKFMTVSASIRYTADDYWLVLRGRGMKASPLGFKQYHNLCSVLLTSPEFSGSAFSTGDDYIDKCAKKKSGPGNPGTWRQVGTNHHIAKIVKQLSIYP
jgi:hypothetical protein